MSTTVQARTVAPFPVMHAAISVARFTDQMRRFDAMREIAERARIETKRSTTR